tara:strand:- start:1181 stop:2464 length:1284 start_codon:yes stop_codon:yes gene_type:complete
MAQTIQIKRSTSNAAPSSSLATGELAYSFLGTSHKLYIGDGTDNHAIGGKSFTDKVNAATASNTASVIVMRDANKNINADKFQTPSGNSDDWNTAAGYGNHATQGYLTSHQDISGKVDAAGDSITGDLSFGDNVKASFGASGDLKIFHDGTSNPNASMIEESGAGNLIIKGSNIEMQSSTGDLYGQFVQGGVTQLYTNNIVSLITTADGITVKDSAGAVGTVNGKISTLSNHTTNDLSEGTGASANLYYTNARVDTRVDTILNHSNHVNISAANGSNGEVILTAASQYGDSNVTNLLANAATVNFTHFTFQGSTLKSGGTMTLDPAAHVGDSGAVGTVVIEGDLQVKGTTTTIDSNTVAIGDSEIYLNSDLANNTAPSQDAGFRVNRGNANAVYLNWDESADNWMLNDGSTSSVITHSNSTIDGGTF